ncbi:MAG: sigma-70 family RNA polymerase sigma factor [Saprospiraceae bacterium]|nr:sigma-70 family RNA polymerase sigma factor [Saprospiraceae bacterium]
MEPKEIERQLLTRCLAGDQQAQFQLYQRYVKAMYNTAIRIVGRPDEAQDVLQDGFTKVFQQLHTFRQESGIGSWIKRIIVNTALNALRSKKRLFYVELDQNLEQIAESSDTFLDIDAEIIHNAIKQLPDGARVVFTLFAVEQLSHQEIAQQLGVSESTSKTQYRRAKQLLKDALPQITTSI